MNVTEILELGLRRHDMLSVLDDEMLSKLGTINCSRFIPTPYLNILRSNPNFTYVYQKLGELLGSDPQRESYIYIYFRLITENYRFFLQDEGLRNDCFQKLETYRDSEWAERLYSAMTLVCPHTTILGYKGLEKSKVNNTSFCKKLSDALNRNSSVRYARVIGWGRWVTPFKPDKLMVIELLSGTYRSNGHKYIFKQGRQFKSVRFNPQVSII